MRTKFSGGFQLVFVEERPKPFGLEGFGQLPNPGLIGRGMRQEQIVTVVRSGVVRHGKAPFLC